MYMQTQFNNIQSWVNQNLPSPAFYLLSLLPQPEPSQMLSSSSPGWQLHRNLHSVSIRSDRPPRQLRLWGTDSLGGDTSPPSHTTFASDGPQIRKEAVINGEKEPGLLISQGFLFVSVPFLFFNTHQGIIMGQLNSDSSLCKWHLNAGKQLTNKRGCS